MEYVNDDDNDDNNANNVINVHMSCYNSCQIAESNHDLRIRNVRSSER